MTSNNRRFIVWYRKPTWVRNSFKSRRFFSREEAEFWQGVYEKFGYTTIMKERKK